MSVHRRPELARRILLPPAFRLGSGIEEHSRLARILRALTLLPQRAIWPSVKVG